MKSRVIFCLIIFLCLFLSTGHCLANGTPSVYVAEPEIQLEPVLEGKVVIHEFMIENKGDALLTINSVRAP